MKYRDYDTLPLKIFARILEDEKNIELLGLTGTEAKEVWDKIRNEYNEKHPTDDEIVLVDAYKKAQLSSVRLNKLAILLSLIEVDGEETKKLYEEAGISFKSTIKERLDYLKVQIDKETQKLEIFKAQINKLEEDISKKSKKEKSRISLQQINDSMASLETNGIHIGDYDAVTCGRYDSLIKMINKKAAKNG